MIQINTVESKHSERSEFDKKHNIMVHFKAFPSITDDDKRRLAKVTQALNRVGELDGKIKLNDACNLYFKDLGRNKTFHELWTNGGIFVNLWPNSPKGEFAVGHPNNKDITIADWCLDTQTASMVAATLVHELAHFAGAPAGDYHHAERAVLKCGFKDEYDPTLVGSLELFSYMLTRVS